jgi:replication fork protection complex subunit Csm3/Swi3
MLNMYQLWLDDLYPRAKFADGLAIIEKLGHTKRIQAMRKQWIDEGKPRHTTVQDEDEPEPFEDDPAPQVDPGQMEGIEMEEATHGEEQEIDLPERPREPADASLDDGPDEDELDALLAESAAPVASKSTASAPPKPAPDLDDPFADEMEAMADMDW